MTGLPSSRAVTRTGCPPTIGMEDENFLEKTTSTEREEDTMTLISFPNKMLQMYIITMLSLYYPRLEETQEERGFPWYPEGQEQTAPWFTTLQLALAPQEVSGPLQGSLHL